MDANMLSLHKENGQQQIGYQRRVVDPCMKMIVFRVNVSDCTVPIRKLKEKGVPGRPT